MQGEKVLRAPYPLLGTGNCTTDVTKAISSAP